MQKKWEYLGYLKLSLGKYKLPWSDPLFLRSLKTLDEWNVSGVSTLNQSKCLPMKCSLYLLNWQHFRVVWEGRHTDSNSLTRLCLIYLQNMVSIGA
jgi:hypothetical protein